MPALYLVTPRASGGGQIAAADINQLVNTLTGNQNTPVSIKNTDPIAYTLQLQNSDAAGKALLIYGPDGTTVLARVQANGVVASPDGTAAAPVVTTTHAQTLTNKTLTAPHLTSPVVDSGNPNLGPGLTQLTTYAVRVFNSANLNITTGVQTAIGFDSERYKTSATMHDTVTNNTRLTAPVAGKYRITGHVAFTQNASGTYRYVFIRLNGATLIAAQSGPPLGAGAAVLLNVSATYALAATDYVELVAQHDVGATIQSVAIAAYCPEFEMEYVSA